MKISFIIKPLNGKKDKKFQKELLRFRKEGAEIEENFTTIEEKNNARNLAKKAVFQRFDKIIFVGGDGILNEGLNGIMEATNEKIPSDLVIGIIPTGSGNNFAKALKIPKNFKEGFSVIKNNKTTLVDIGKANNRFFINCLSFGFDAQINKLANDLKSKYRFIPKEFSYLLAAIKEIIIKIPIFEIKIESKEKNKKQKVVLLALTNGPSYGAIFKVNPGASYDDGQFDVCIVKSVGKLRALYDILKVIQGTHTNLPEIEMFRTSSLKISSLAPLPYEMDGEVLTPEKEYSISLFPKVIKILTP